MIFAALLLFAGLVSAAGLIQYPRGARKPGVITSEGCFSLLSSTAEEQYTDEYLNVGSCAEFCRDEQKLLSVTHKSECFCADTLPAASSLVRDEQCNFSCPGWPKEACGGIEAYSVMNTGL
ncbi:hypothetical protein FZEAL_31 [Fusarium zealandicum]|uniref:WSC domain-containing protein n=1 Tax=Fusarium zealandicum TaxID=1053134 RepID=A0A8H4UVL4_9HYPO|nr:hypothetical protein FZEAL_31 [Fusarium zealandicum]